MTTDVELDLARENAAVRYLQAHGDVQANAIAVKRDGPTTCTYHLSRDQLETLKDSCKPSRSIYKPAGNPAWKTLSEEMGFQWETVQRDGIGNSKFFRAVPTPGWQRQRATITEELPPLRTGPNAETVALNAQIDDALATGDHERAALLAAQLAHPSEYLKAMERCFEVHRLQQQQRLDAHSLASHFSPPTTGDTMKYPVFELDKQTVKITSFNPRAELNGEDPVPAADVSMIANLPNESLAMFSASLRGMLFCKNKEADLADAGTDAPTKLRYPKLGPLSWGSEIIGARVEIDHGLGGPDGNVVLELCTLKKFKIDPQEGGTCIVSFQVQGHPGERECGKLSMMVGRDVEITIEPPKAPKGDLVEQAQHPDKPLATAGDAERASTRKQTKKEAKEAAQAAFEQA